MGALELVVSVLVIARVARLIAKDEGPFGWFHRVRLHLDLYRQNTWLKRGLLCEVCVGFYPFMGLGLYLAQTAGASVLVGIAYGLALSAVGVLLIKGD